MARCPVDPLRPFTEEERSWLRRVSRSHREPAAHVARAKALLAVAAGQSYTDAAQAAGRRSGDAVAHLVARFNREGLVAVEPQHGGGRRAVYTEAERARIVAEADRVPDRTMDGTATWSLTTLQRALRRAPDGLPRVSTFTIWHVLQAAGRTWQRDRSWCTTGRVLRKRTDRSRCGREKKLIEDAYMTGEAEGLAVWTEDEAGPFQTIPVPGHHWRPEATPARYPHEHLRAGTAKLLTLFHPTTGEVRVQGVGSCTNVVLHGWLDQQLEAVLVRLPPPAVLSPAEHRARWQRWQAGLHFPFTLPAELPPLRMLVVLDNLTGHKTPGFVLWLVAHGVMPLYTPLGGSWLNMTESVQRILVRRGLAGTHPETVDAIISALEATAAGWNAAPTPFEWGGRRAARRQRSRERRHRLGGSGACTRRPLRRPTALAQWQRSTQLTH